MYPIADNLEETIHERKLKHLERDTTTPVTPENQISEFCQQIIDEIFQTKTMTAKQLDNILSNPGEIPDVMRFLSDISYNLEKEYEMAENCLNKITQDENIAELFKSCILPLCNDKPTNDFILNKCFQHIENPSYSKIFSLIVDANPSEYMWHYVLKMKDGFAESAMNLLYNKIFPPDKKAIIAKMKEYPSIEDMNLLSLLRLTKEEFIEAEVDQIALNILKTSILNSGENIKDSELAKMSEVFKFIGNKMVEIGVYYPEFTTIAINLINEGILYQIQESVKFLYRISSLFPIELLISTDSLEKICDLINSESNPASIQSSLFLLLLCLDKFPEETLKCLNSEYLSNSLNLVAEKTDSFNEIIEKIFSIITPSE